MVILFFLTLIVSCSRPIEYEYNDFIFGSYLRIKINTQDSLQANRAVKKVMQYFYHIDSVASSFNPQSEVSHLNKIGKAKMSEDLKLLIEKSLEVSEKSDGVFDITVGPAMKSFGFYDSTTESQRTQRKKKVEDIIGYKNIRIKEDSIFLKPGMMIDLGGLTVGYALDKVQEILKSEGIKSGLIDAGGDIICFGDRVYNIGIKDPIQQGIIKTIKIKNQAISTSGNYEKFIEKDNQKYTHIINPKTGQAISDKENSLCSVTIIADKCVDADAYATAVFVAGINSGQNLIRKLKLKGVLIRNDGKIIEIK